MTMHLIRHRPTTFQSEHRYRSNAARLPLGCAPLMAAAALALWLPAAPVSGALIELGVYRLYNHPDGNAGPPAYGLRLDELFDVTPEHDRFTFDFDHPDSSVFMEYDGSTLRIFGVAFGGLDGGDQYDPDPALTSLVQLDFTYTVIGLVDGDDDLIVTTANFTNHGTITWLDTGEVIDLYDRANADGYTFRFGDEDDDRGHRGALDLSGWGWLDHHTAGSHVYSSDWLFTGTRMPGPSGLGILAVGFLFARRRRRRI